MKKVIITRAIIDICHMQVCAERDATDEEILRVCNLSNPAGTTNGWVTVIRAGAGAPVVCSEHPERLHFLVSC